MKALGNKKGISSEDIFGQKEEKSEEVKQRFDQLKGAKAISSDMFFGREEEEQKRKSIGEQMEGYFGRSSLNSTSALNNVGNGSYDEYKEAAAKMVEKAQENAKLLKDKALDWLSTFAQH